MNRNAFVLTAEQVIDAVRALDGEDLPLRTFASWAPLGVVVPSVAWRGTRRAERLYNLSDLARTRLVVRLRRHGFSMNAVRVVLAFVDVELRDVLHPRTTAQLVVNGNGTRAAIVRAGEPALEVPSGQYVLPLRDVVAARAEVERATA